jgi:hypothetical protein
MSAPDLLSWDLLRAAAHGGLNVGFAVIRSHPLSQALVPSSVSESVKSMLKSSKVAMGLGVILVLTRSRFVFIFMLVVAIVPVVVVVEIPLITLIFYLFIVYRLSIIAYCTDQFNTIPLYYIIVLFII